MTVKWTKVALFLYDIVIITSPSITGVTYRDDFDFEQRYRDENECNPFYWHPLHLPAKCAVKYEKKMRSNLKFKGRIRYVYPEVTHDLPFPIYEFGSAETEYETTAYENPWQYETAVYVDPFYEIASPQYELPEYKTINKHKHSMPYDKVLKYLKKDIKKDPSRPRIGVLPFLGPVAIYDQEVSKKSETLIKELATAYGKLGQESYAQYMGYNDENNPQLYVWDSKKNGTKPKKNKSKKKENLKDRITRTKTKHGGVVTIVESLSPRKRRRRSVLYLLGL